MARHCRPRNNRPLYTWCVLFVFVYRMDRKEVTLARSMPSQVDIDRELIRRRGLTEFVKRAWGQVDTSPLIWGWHLDAIAEHLDAVHKRQIRDLVINQPPATSKSLVASVLWPAYVWTVDPEHRWIMASYDAKVSLRDARKHRALVETDWYRRCWPHVKLPPSRDASVSIAHWYNTAGGMRFTTTVRGSVTGQHGDTFDVDDPVDPQGARAASGSELDAVLEWWHETIPMRFRDPPNSARVLTMQRLHEKDLAAEMIRAGATVLCLPMRYERKHPHCYAKDPRKEDGELLCPERYPEEVVKQLEQTFGPSATAAQLQQRPAPAGGGVFKEAWFKYWTELPEGGTYCQSWDLAFKDAADSSYVVGQVWYVKGADFYLVDQHRERMSFSRTVEAIKAMSARYPKSHKKLVEDKANGPAVADALKRDVPGIQLVTPEGGKIARANAVESLVAAGNVFLPDPGAARYPDGRRGAPWVKSDFLPEVTVFPNAANDDQVDAMTQALNALAPRHAERLKAAMDGFFGRR